MLTNYLLGIVEVNKHKIILCDIHFPDIGGTYMYHRNDNIYDSEILPGCLTFSHDCGCRGDVILVAIHDTSY